MDKCPGKRRFAPIESRRLFFIRYWPIAAILGYGSDCTAARDMPQAMLMTATNTKSIVSSNPRLAGRLACRLLSPPLLTCLRQFADVRRWTDLDDSTPQPQSRTLGNELDCVIQISRFKHPKSTQLLLRFRVRTVGHCNLSVLPIHGHRRVGGLKWFLSDQMSVLPQFVVVAEALVQHVVALALRHVFELAGLEIAQTDVFHCSSPHSGLTNRQHSVPSAPRSRYYSACSEAAVARLFTCFRRVLVPEPGRKEARAPRPPHRRRWHPCAPTRVPRPYRRLPVSRNRPCAPWSRCMAHR